MTFTILPCPFCGQPGEMRETYQRITVGCFNDNCLAGPFVAINYIRTRSPEPYKPGLISAWNTRAPALEPVEDGELERVKAVASEHMLNDCARIEYLEKALKDCRAMITGERRTNLINALRITIDEALARHKAGKGKA